MFWKPRTVIELVVNRWWVNNTLFVASAMGIKNFGVIEVDGLDTPQISEKIETCLAAFAVRDQDGIELGLQRGFIKIEVVFVELANKSLNIWKNYLGHAFTR